MANEVKKLVGAKIGESEFELIKKVAGLRGEDVSSFLRRAIRKELAELSFLDRESKRALGISKEK